MQVFKEIQKCKMPTNTHLELMTIGFSLLQNIQKKRKYKPTVNINHFQSRKMLKQNIQKISFTYLPGHLAPVSFFLLLFLGTKTIKQQAINCSI